MKALLIILSLMLPVTGFAKPHKVIVVGGGIAGLTAAWKLKKKDIMVLEQWPEVGGRIWEGYYEGFSYARGAEYLGEPWGVLKKIVKKYKLDPIEVIYPSITHYNPAVPGFKDMTLYHGFDGIAFMHVVEDGNDREALDTYNRFMRETTELVDETYDAGELPHWFDLDHPVAEYDFVTMREWFQMRGFGETYQNKWDAHARGLYGANMDEVSILMAISELGWEYYDEDPIDMPDETWNEYQTDLYPEEVFTFMGGISEIPQAIANDPKLAGKIQTNAKVTNVEQKGKLYEVTYLDKLTGQTETLESKSVVMAVPAPVVLQIAPTLFEGEKKEILEQIQYCQYVTVNLFSAEPIQNFAFELSTPEDFFVIAFYDSLWAQKWEEPDNPLNDEVFITTAYAAGQTCDENLVDLSDDEIMDLVMNDLEKVFPGDSSKVLEHQINRFRYAYPLMDLGAYHRIVRLNELNMEKPRKVVLVGDYMALPTVEAAMAQAHDAAKKVK